MIHYKGYVSVTLHVNGEHREVIIRPADTLLRVLREQLGLTGTKIGCENGDCGACTVLINGKPIKSCMVLAVEVTDNEITTIEGLSETAIQEAFLEEGGFQCGFCTSGFLLNAYALLENHPEPNDNEIRLWLEGNLCRVPAMKESNWRLKQRLRKRKTVNKIGLEIT